MGLSNIILMILAFLVLVIIAYLCVYKKKCGDIYNFILDELEEEDKQ